MKPSARQIGSAIALLTLGWVLWVAFAPGPRLASPLLLDIAPGAGRRQIAAQLRRADVVRSAASLEAWSLLHRGATLKAGTYRFTGGETALGVFQRLARGDVFTVAVVVPEGFNRFDIAREVAQRGIGTAEAFLAVTANPARVRDLDAAAVSLEGYLYPDTYKVSPHIGVSHLADLMVARFRHELKRQPTLRGGAGLHRNLVLASLVEKETSDAAERPLIAGVFNNRLQLGWTLQCDPTVIYAALLAHRYQGTIHRSDLVFDSPYNTYIHAGLPPGPIANPGLPALMAAARPAVTPYLYFVSTGQGTHRFATTLAEHNRNLALYLRTLHGR